MRAPVIRAAGYDTTVARLAALVTKRQSVRTRRLRRRPATVERRPSSVAWHHRDFLFSFAFA